jgi:hypothetical protein
LLDAQVLGVELVILVVVDKGPCQMQLITLSGLTRATAEQLWMDKKRLVVQMRHRRSRRWNRKRVSLHQWNKGRVGEYERGAKARDRNL